MELLAPYRNQFLEGVNYGNRFIPEPWMSSDDESIFKTKYGPEVIKPNDDFEDVSFCDIDDERILKYLDDKILEEDFQKMSSWGVKLVRVPTGYWNWIDLGWETTPYTPVEREAQRFRNMQMITPDQYAPYIDKIFTWAKQYDMKVLIEMHGAPGSQNGEMHSGCITGPK